MKECSISQLVQRLAEIGKTENQIQEILSKAKEYSKTADAVYIWNKDTPINTVVQCQIVNNVEHWFMQG